MAIRDGFVETRHGKIAISETEGDGHPVLLIHGNSNCRKVFRHQLEGPLGAHYRIIAMDLPGHGDSDDAADPATTYTQPAYAEAAADVLGARDAFHAVVMGWSLGGHIGIEMTRICPEMTALTFSGTPPCGPGAESVGQAFTPLPHMSFTSKEVFSEEDAIAYATHTCGVDLPLDPELLAAVKRTDGRARQTMFNDWTDNVGCDQRAAVESWPKPIAVIQGSDEAFFDNGYLEALRWKNLWSGQIHVIEGGGHAPFWAKPDAYNAIFARFLSEVTA